MNGKILAIPKSEVAAHFEINGRFDLKVVAPEMLGPALLQKLRSEGRKAKSEERFEGQVWRHAAPGEPNPLCLSSDFADGETGAGAAGPFALSFANERAEQDEHYHEHHTEVYVSDQPITARCRKVESGQVEEISLPDGGVLAVSANVIHKVSLSGFTVIIELPAVAGDKKKAPL